MPWFRQELITNALASGALSLSSLSLSVAHGSPLVSHLLSVYNSLSLKKIKVASVWGGPAAALGHAGV